MFAVFFVTCKQNLKTVKIRISLDPRSRISNRLGRGHFTDRITADIVIVLSSVGFRIIALGHAAFFIKCFGSAVDAFRNFDFTYAKNIV